MTEKKVRVGIFSTSWWADAMYLPALMGHGGAEVTAVCGRNQERADAFAAQWDIPNAYTNVEQMLDEAPLDAVIVATRNDSHYEISMAALERGLHVLCEKPMAFTAAEADAMVAKAIEKGVTTMVPFTYRFMPTNRYIKELVDSGYIGRPYHLNLRYYTGYARAGEYLWRFDQGKAGPGGCLGDIVSHFLYLAEWFFGEIVAVNCQLGWMVERPLLNPEGEQYKQGDDTAMLMLTFASGAQGFVQATTIAYEDTPFGQIHQMELHGSEGTIHSYVDWDKTQTVSGARVGEGPTKPLTIPEHVWGKVRRDTVHNTYKDVFRVEGHMIGEWITAVSQNQPADPDFIAGAHIQRVIDAALESDAKKCQILVK